MRFIRATYFYTLYVLTFFSVHCMGAQASWHLQLIKSYAAPSRATKRPVAWDASGRTIFSSWGAQGSDVVLIDIASDSPTILAGETYTISGIAYKNDGPSGVATIAIDPNGSGKSHARLWDISNKTSQLLTSPDFDLQHGIVSLAGDVYAMVQMGQHAALVPPGALQWVSDRLVQTASLSGMWASDVASLSGGTACIVGVWTIGSTVLGLVYDGTRTKIVRELHSEANDYITMFIRAVGDTIYTFGWHQIKNTSGASYMPSIVQWTAQQTVGSRFDITALSHVHNMPSAFDVNTLFAAGACANGSLFVSSISHLSKPLAQVPNIAGYPALSIAWNPSNPYQCAIGTSEGVYVFQMVHHTKRNRTLHNRSVDQSEQLYRAWYRRS